MPSRPTRVPDRYALAKDPSSISDLRLPEVAAEVNGMTNRGILRRGRAGLVIALVALAMLFAAIPASANPGRGNGGPPPAHPTNITWE